LAQCGVSLGQSDVDALHAEVLALTDPLWKFCQESGVVSDAGLALRDLWRPTIESND